VQSHYKDRKLMVFKYKAKTRYRRKKGHRQTYTRVLIQDILTG
jgi:large subunit ribosomal protein L21